MVISTPTFTWKSLTFDEQCNKHLTHKLTEGRGGGGFLDIGSVPPFDEIKALQVLQAAPLVCVK